MTKTIDGKFHFTDSIVLGNDDGSEQPSEGEGYYTMMMIIMTRKKEERKTNVEAVLGSRMNWSCALALLTKRKKERENDKWTENRKK